MFGGGGGMWGGQMLGDRPAGIPPELIEAARKLTESEPEHELRPISFDPSIPPWPSFSLRSLLAVRRAAIAGVFLIVVVEVVCQQAGPRLTQYAIDHGVLANDFGILKWMVGLYVATIAIAIVAGTVRIRFAGRVGESILYRLRVAVFTQIQRLSMDYFGREKAGVIMTRMTSDVEVLQMLFQEGFTMLLTQVLTLVVVTIILFTMEARLAAIVVFGIMPALVLLTLWFRSASDRWFGAARDRVANVLSDLQENLSGVRVVAAYNRQRRNVARHRDTVASYTDANHKTARISALYGPATEAIGVGAQAVLLVIGGHMVIDGSLSIGKLTAFVLYLNSFMIPIQQLVQVYTQYQQGRAAIAKLRELFDQEPTVGEDDDAPDLPPINGRISLDGITFSYRPGEPVLHDIRLDIAAGETIALVGPTGSGKSTIAKLLARFYDPDAGIVRIDGHDIRDVQLMSLRRQLGIVPQIGFLFGGTIRDNIAFGREGASDDALLAACERIGISELVQRLPNGLDTLCHERGVTLSTGERQLIALARALVADPRVLVLDEATSNLDLATEAKIERALDVLLDGRTAILIAHRLNTARRADRIVVLDRGRIVEVGAHDELVGGGGVYTRLHDAWSRRTHTPNSDASVAQMETDRSAGA
jgi:ATP-binding cassette, subfamily B, bacterial